MSTASPARRSAAARSEAIVAGQLRQVRQRIRLLDVTAALLGFAILTMLYGLGMVLADRAYEMTALVRQLAFGVYLLSAGLYLGSTLVWPLCRRVNPYYAALQVEQTVPEAKNSVISWLDLHEQPLPASIRAAVSNKAARDISEADLECAVSPRRNLWLTAAVFALGLALLAQLVIGGPQFFSLLRRAFMPFSEGRITTRTQLRLLKPETGDITVPVGRAVSFAVEVRGKVPSSTRPDALRLLYRYHQEDPYEEQRLEPGDNPGEWATIVPAFQVHNGFWYKVAGGDAETPEYHVSVRSTPLLTDFEAIYRFRPYLGWKEQTTREPNLKALRGTEVTLIARANRNVREAKLELIEQKQFLAAERVAGEPQAMQFRWVLDRDGTYRIAFTSDDGETNSDPMPYEIKVLADLTPRVALTQPDKDVTLPINQKLELRGSAYDDFGLANVTLRLQTGQAPLNPMTYPKDGLKRQADGSPPRNVDYQESVALDQLTLDGMKLKPLKPGDVVEYWLEAADYCDYPPPGPNVGKSERFKVTLAEPAAPPPPEQNNNEQPQQQQNKDGGKNDNPQDQPKTEPGKNDKPQEQPKQDGAPQQPQDKGDGQPNADQKPGAGKNEGASTDQGQNADQSPEDKRVEEQKQRLERALQDREKEQQNKDPNSGQSKSEPGKEGQAKSTNDNQGQAKPQDRQQTEKPDAGKPDPGQQTDKSDKGQAKPDAGQQTDKSDKTQSKPDAGQQTDKSDKTQGKPDPGQQTDKTDKAQGKPDAGQQTDKSDKAQGKPDAGQQTDKSDKTQGKPDDRQQTDKSDKGQAKTDDRQQTDKSDKGQAKPDAGQQTDKTDKGQAKPDAGQQTDKSDKGQGKPDPAKPNKKPGGDSQEGQGKPGDKAPPQPAGATGDKKAEPKPQEKGKDDQPKDITGRKEIDDAGKNAEQRTGSEKQGADDKAKLEKLDEAMKKVAEQLKDADPKTKQQLLDKAKELAKDPQTREALEKKLKEAAQNPQTKEKLEQMLKEASKGADKKPSPQPGGDDAKSDNSSKNERNETGKPAEPGPNSGTTKGTPDKSANPEASRERQRPEHSEPGREREQPEAPGTGQGKKPPEGKPQPGQPPQGQSQKPGQPGANPGRAGDGDRQTAGQGNRIEAPEGAPADPRFQKKAGELQLEDFKKRVTKDVLQKAKMTEAEFEQFKKAYEEMLKRRAHDAAQKNEQLVDPKRGGGILKNQGPSQVKGGPKQDALQGGVQRHAPPEYQEKYNEFTEKLSTLKRDRDR